MVTEVVVSDVVNTDGTYTIDGNTYYDFNETIKPANPAETIYLLNENAEPFILNLKDTPSKLQSGWQYVVDNKTYEITNILNSHPHIVSCEDHIIYFGDDYNLESPSTQTKVLPKTTIINNEEYTIKSILGAGNFGVVYLLVNKNDPKNKLVLKLPLDDTDALTQNVEDQFYAHLGLARGKDSQGNQVIAFMENCQTLYDEVFERDDGTKADLGERIKIAINMLSAYKRFQDKFDDADKPTHRDISPKNFLINTATKECTLFDFGLSYQREIIANTIRDKQGAEQAHSLMMGVKGSTRYMAPQMFDMKSTPDPTYDHYSLGVIVGEILGSRIDLYDEKYNHEFFSPELRANLTAENLREAFKYRLRVNNAGDTIALLTLNHDNDLEKSPLDYEIIEIVQQMVKTFSGTPNMMKPEISIKKLEELQIKHLIYEALKADEKVDQYRDIDNAVIKFMDNNHEINDKFIQNLNNLLSSPPCSEINDATKNKLVTILAQKNSLIYDEKLLEAVYKQIPYYSDQAKKIDITLKDMPFSVISNDKNQVFLVLAKPLTSGDYFAQNLNTKEWVKVNIAWDKHNLKLSGENINILSGTVQQQCDIFSQIIKEKKKCEEALLLKKPDYNNENEIENIFAELISIVNENPANKKNPNLIQKVRIVAGYFAENNTLTPFLEAYGALQTILRSTANPGIAKTEILKKFILAAIEKAVGNDTIPIEFHNDKPMRMLGEYAQCVLTKVCYTVENGKVTDKLAFNQSTIQNGEVADKILKSLAPKPAPDSLSVTSYKSNHDDANLTQPTINDDDIPSPSTSTNNADIANSPPVIHRKGK